MSCEYEAADEVVRLGMKGMETGARVLESGAEHLARAVSYYLIKEKKANGPKGGAKLANLLRRRKAMKAYTIFDEDVDKFCSLAKIYGVDFFLLKDETFADSITDIIVEEADANKMNHIYKLLSLESPQRVRLGGPDPSFSPEKMSEEDKAKERKPEILKKSAATGRWQRALELRLKEHEDRAYIERKYALPTKRPDTKSPENKKEREEI